MAMRYSLLHILYFGREFSVKKTGLNLLLYHDATSSFAIERKKHVGLFRFFCIGYYCCISIAISWTMGLIKQLLITA